MSILVHAVPAFLRTSLATMFQYRGEIVLWAVWGVVYPAVAIALWSSAVGSAEGASIHGFGPREFAAYFLMTMIVGHVGTAWDLYEMGHLVRSGAMSPRLLQPILPIWQSVADNIAYKLLTLVLLLPCWVGVAWLTQPHFATERMHLLLGVPALFLAGVINYIWGYNLALLSFWITRSDGIGELWFGASLFLGGRLAPLTIMPVPLQWLAAALPFKWVIWFPSAALIGQLSNTQIIWGLIAQICWLAGGLLCFRVVWRAAIKRYSAVGA